MLNFHPLPRLHEDVVSILSVWAPARRVSLITFVMVAG